MASNLIITSTEASVDADQPKITGTTLGSKHAMDVTLIGSGGLATIIDESVSGTTYIGVAQVASLQASGVWQIKRIIESSGITTITYADGNAEFDNVWNNRASLTYS